MCRITLTLAAAFILGACGAYDTDHPEFGKIVSLTTEWSDRGEGIAIPAGYTAAIGDYAVELSGVTNTIDNLFAPGRYNIYVYNPAAGITVNGNRAVADYTAGIPDWLFTGTENIMIERDTDYEVAVAMRQQIRELTLRLEITGDAADRLTAIDAELSGVAGAWNLDTNAPAAINAVTVSFPFTRSGEYHSATIRLLGMTGAAQELSLTLRFTDGNPASYTVTSDLSDVLAGFNDDKKTPASLAAIMAVTPTQSGLTTTVSDWVEGGSSEGVAE